MLSKVEDDETINGQRNYGKEYIYRKDSVANVAMNIAELLGGGGREVVQRQGVGSSRRVRGGHVFF